MTSAAECAAVAPKVTKHAARATNGESSGLNSAQATLAAIGAGTITAAQTASAIYATHAASAGVAAMRAGNAGDPQGRLDMLEAQRILLNLSQGL